MSLEELEPSPLSKWATRAVEIAREKGLSDDEIKADIRRYAKSRKYEPEQINRVLQQNKIRLRNRRHRYNEPSLTICPKCVTIGKINVYYPEGKLYYVIVHEKVAGTWGNSIKKPRHRRCYIRGNSENGEYIRQKLEFYEKRHRQDVHELIQGFVVQMS